MLSNSAHDLHKQDLVMLEDVEDSYSAPNDNVELSKG